MVPVMPVGVSFTTWAADVVRVAKVEVLAAHAPPPAFRAKARKWYVVEVDRPLTEAEPAPSIAPSETEPLQFAAVVPPSVVP